MPGNLRTGLTQSLDRWIFISTRNIFSNISGTRQAVSHPYLLAHFFVSESREVLNISAKIGTISQTVFTSTGLKLRMTESIQ